MLNHAPKSTILILISLTLSAQITYKVQSLASGLALGQITCQDSSFGLLCQIKLSNIKSGPHGLHIHTKPSCENQGLAAAGHLMLKDQTHLGPYNTNSHLGDLPEIIADVDGTINTVILAPRLKENQIVNTAIIIHKFGDNYSDSPKTLGGGGPRIACGLQIVKNKHSKQSSR